MYLEAFWWHWKPVISTFHSFPSFSSFWDYWSEQQLQLKDRRLAHCPLLGTRKEWLTEQALIEKWPNIGILWMQRLRQGCREINWPAAAALFFLWMMATFPAGGWTLDSSQCFHVALNTLCKEQQIEEKFFMVHCRSTDMHATKTFTSWYNVLCLVKVLPCGF